LWDRRRPTHRRLSQIGTFDPTGRRHEANDEGKTAEVGAGPARLPRRRRRGRRALPLLREGEGWHSTQLRSSGPSSCQRQRGR
jgi:hypothetical protein